MSHYVLEWRDTRSGETALCETGAEFCYEWYTTMQAAADAATLLNTSAIRDGHSSRYGVKAGPEGLVYPLKCCMDEKHHLLV